MKDNCVSTDEHLRTYEDRDINLKRFLIDELFVQSPKPAHMYQLTLPEETPIREFLAYFICLGARQIYQKELAELSADQIEHLRKYLQSIGWDVEYTVETRMQQFEDNERQVNYFLIDFKQCELDL